LTANILRNFSKARPAKPPLNTGTVHKNPFNPVFLRKKAAKQRFFSFLRNFTNHRQRSKFNTYLPLFSVFIFGQTVENSIKSTRKGGKTAYDAKGNNSSCNDDPKAAHF
jgi:hypothetical protein